MAQAAGWGGSRLLLKRMRDVMAREASAQDRLDQIVRLIAADMVAEVCSAYVMRAGEVLELFATEGLNREAVHKTRMRVGEGLVGDIAAHGRSLALSDAWSYPNFAYRPETGEDIYRSFLGVPVRRDSRVLGVLSVQNKATRTYTEEEIETLEIIAMVLAELIASGELVNPTEAIHADATAINPRRLDGVRMNGGIAIGRAVLHRPRIVIRQMVAEDPVLEVERLNTAVNAMRQAIDKLFEREEVRKAGDFQDVLETYRMFAEDRGWLHRMSEVVRTGLTAEAAVQRVQNDMRARLREATDPYLKERLSDLEDLTSRLLVQLMGNQAAAVPDGPLPEDTILFARSMGPSELLDYDRRRLRGLVLEESSPASHVAIVARALEIPVVGRVKDVLDRVDPGDAVVVDGDNGQIFLRPGGDVLAGVRQTIQARTELKARYAELRALPTVTRDGVPIRLLLNAGLSIDVANLDQTGADGIGLFRTEIPFMMRSSYPGLATQTELYSQVLDVAGDRPVTFRTLDIGGDKPLPYLESEKEENPAMGWRAVRMTLDRPAMLRQQLRALIRAASGRALSVMFPMVSEVAEFDAARSILDLELDRCPADKRPKSLRVGVMVEVPALLWQLDRLLPRVDFLSVGSNDLLQFLFAMDRGTPRIADRYDSLSLPMIAVLRDLVTKADAAKVSITLCGEMAGRPIEAMMLLGIGFRSISMSAGSIGPVKMMARSLEIAPLARYIDSLSGQDLRSIRGRLSAYARDHDVIL